jgi:hypothetical protein
MILPAVILMFVSPYFSMRAGPRGPEGAAAVMTVLFRVLFFATLLSVPAILLYRRYLVRQIDPNELDVELRKKRGWKRAMSQKEYDRIFNPNKPPLRPTPEDEKPVALAPDDDETLTLESADDEDIKPKRKR